MTLLPIVRSLIERKAVAREVIRDTEDKRWLEGIPPELAVRWFSISHECPAAPVLVTVRMTLMRFLMDMRPQVGVLVYVGQCRFCSAAFFGEFDGDAPPSVTQPPQINDPKGPHRRK